ncbi:MAG TPA: hypothetical protein VKV06_08055 [Acidimicrobiales bacterium]|nr:hypothetical protein [Acidimicrobiales bacterium]
MDVRLRESVRPAPRVAAVAGVRPTRMTSASPGVSRALALQRAAGNRATSDLLRHVDVSPSGIIVQRQDGDEPATGTTTAETWSEWAWRNRWKIALGTGVVLAAGIAYYAYSKGNAPNVPMSEVPTGDGGALAEGATALTQGATETAATVATETATNVVADTATSVVSNPAPTVTESIVSHAWEPGKAYTVADKLQGLVGLLPGGGAAVKTAQTCLDPSAANQEQLVAELAKLACGPYGVLASTWDNVATILSYYSSGKIEIGTTVDLLRTAGQGMASFEAATGMPASLAPVL